MVVFVPLMGNTPVGERTGDVVPLGVTVVIEPPLSTETKGWAEEEAEAEEAEAEEAEVIVREDDGVTEVSGVVEEVDGATRVHKARRKGST
jgi:hypothetical protein